MPKKQNTELHNEEVREIMKVIPGRIIHWGLAVIFLIFGSIIIGSCFFTFRETVTAPLVITPLNPPAPIICKVSGKIGCRFVSDGQIVDKGEIIALIENSTRIKDFLRTEKLVNHLDSIASVDDYYGIKLPVKLILGDLHKQYDKFYHSLKEFRDYYEKGIILKKIELLHQQVNDEEQRYQLLLRQKKMMEQELNIMQKKLERHESMLKNEGISIEQLEDEKVCFIRSQIEYTNFMASLKSIEMNKIQQKYSLLELREQHQKTIKYFEVDLTENIRILKIALADWRDKYLLSSPIKGVVIFNDLPHINQEVSAGECLATIEPEDNLGFVCKAIVPLSDIGKVNPGQKVTIKLNGYPRMKYCVFYGNVNIVSRVPQDKGYVIDIKLSDSIMSNQSNKIKLVGEMNGTAEIVVNETRLIYRFITPLKMLFDK